MEIHDLPDAGEAGVHVYDNMHAECDRIRALNGNTQTYTAFASTTRLGVRRGVQNYMGIEDRRFLARQSVDSRLPASQLSGNAMPIQRAIEIGAESAVVELLSEFPAWINLIRNAHGETLLHTAVLHDHIAIVQSLLELGADPTIELPHNGESQSTLESVAPRSENLKDSRVLHAAEATPVHYACAVGNLDILKLLLGAARQYKKTAPFKIHRAGSLLVWAITAGHPKIVEFLTLKKRLEEDCFDEDGNNSFTIAALALGDPVHSSVLKAIVKLLVRCPTIEINHKNMNGLTAFDVAEEPDVKQLLQQFGGRSARVLDMDKLLRWDREQSRLEIEYRRGRVGAIRLRTSMHSNIAGSS